MILGALFDPSSSGVRDPLSGLLHGKGRAAGRDVTARPQALRWPTYLAQVATPTSWPPEDDRAETGTAAHVKVAGITIDVGPGTALEEDTDTIHASHRRAHPRPGAGPWERTIGW